MPEIEIKRKADDLSLVPAKRTRTEISVVGTREKAVVTSSVSIFLLSHDISTKRTGMKRLYFPGASNIELVCSYNVARRAPGGNIYIQVSP